MQSLVAITGITVGFPGFSQARARDLTDTNL